jgi:hypothetical protein
MCAIPRRNYTARWAIARKLYQHGPRSGPELVALFDLDPRGHSNFLMSLERMRLDGNLLRVEQVYYLADDLAACLADMGETAHARACGETALSRAVNFQPLDLDKYPHLKTASHRDAHFVSMSSKVREPEDYIGEL